MKLKHRFRHYLYHLIIVKDKTSELDKIDMYVDRNFCIMQDAKNPEKDYFVKRLILEDVSTRCVD